MKEGREISIPKPGDDKFAAIEELQEFCVGRLPGPESTNRLALELGRSANVVDKVLKRPCVFDCGQGVEISLVGFLTNVGQAMDIRDSFAQVSPGRRSVGISFFLSKDSYVAGVIDRCFSTKNAAVLVIDLD